ncbi:FAD binding domain-containing protein [Erwinia phyllosphaerae]|uniref:FAD binding domain-containing protein n=1 Tax=Erwinia phyllosphaerae TaxID=2853256 RepID=UPI001FEE95DE|nr:xanthine dehydrogenase family protein subunit M [Erwinia phyllosphaerae]
MREFSYQRAADVANATALGSQPETRFLAGGTTQLDLMKCGVERPAALVDITHLPGLNDITLTDSTLTLGTLVKMSQAADSKTVKTFAPALAESLSLAASAQLRNMASLGGNILQRTRCSYFRDPLAYSACNKRQPGSGCAALDGLNHNHAVLGTSDSCIALYPGDFAVALTAFDAVLNLQNARGEQRSVPVTDFFRLPEDRPDLEHQLAYGEMIVSLTLPRSAALARSHYLKVRDRSSYEFAAASAAVGLELEDDNLTIKEARVALGGVATKPWRAYQVEQALRGQRLDEATLRKAAEKVTEGAIARQHNGHKIILAPRVVARALMTVGGLA